MRYRLGKLILGLGIMVSLGAHVDAREFRFLSPITTPERLSLPVDGVAQAQMISVPRDVVIKEFRKLIDKWNTPQFSKTLSDTFFDAERLGDSVQVIAPRDAKLRIQSIQGVQTLQQVRVPNSGEGRDEIVSLVSVTAQTQLEYESSAGAFVKLPGVNEFVLRFRHEAN